MDPASDMTISSLGRLRNFLSVWYRASRPFTLSAAVVPVLIGSALAFFEGRAGFILFALVLIASLLVQIAANLVDEYSDHSRPEGKEKLLAPYKVIALGLLSSRAVRAGAVVCLSAAVIIGLYLVSVAGWPLLVICLASLAAAYFYSAGPRPLGTVGVGHPLVFVFMGPVMVAGSYFVQTRTLTADALWLSVPVACTVTGILVANDLRDLEEDVKGGKVTPVTLFGRGFGRVEWTLLTVLAFGVILAMAAAERITPFAALIVFALPQTLTAARAVWRGKTRPELSLALRASSKLHLYLGLLLAAGLTLGRIWN